MYESAISFALEEEMIGAASLWMVSTRTGEPAANSGRIDKRKAFMVIMGMNTRIGMDQSDNRRETLLRFGKQTEQKMER